MNRLILGVDGGGTKTVARLATDTAHGPLCVLGSGFAAGSNPYSVGWQPAITAIVEAVDAAREQAGVAEALDQAVLAIAGCATESARQMIQKAVAEAGIASSVRVVADTAPLLSDAAPGTPAVGLIAGTGSIAVGQSATGESVEVGGWGYLVDDAGSGYSLGHAALQRVCRDKDQHQATDSRLVETVLKTLAIESLADLKPLIYEHPDPRSKIAQLAPAVVRLAADGDEQANTICREEAAALARLAADCCRRVAGSPTSDTGSEESEPTIDCFLAGGLLVGSAFYRHLVVEELSQICRQTKPRLAPDAACGCLRLARNPVALSR